MKDIILDEMTYIGIAVFFVNLRNQRSRFVYERLSDGSLQIYTSVYPKEFTVNDGQEVEIMFDNSEWKIFKSIEVYTTNIRSDQCVKFIMDEYPELMVKKGFIQEDK